MAFNIPVNLMAGTVAPTPSQAASDISHASNSVASIQPTAAGGDTRGASADGGSGFGARDGRALQLAMLIKQSSPSQGTPDRAEPASVVVAQTTSSPLGSDDTMPKTIPASEKPELPARTASELDRYAPPNPLPTAPILQLAEAYAALSKRAA